MFNTRRMRRGWCKRAFCLTFQRCGLYCHSLLSTSWVRNGEIIFTRGNAMTENGDNEEEQGLKWCNTTICGSVQCLDNKCLDHKKICYFYLGEWINRSGCILHGLALAVGKSPSWMAAYVARGSVITRDEVLVACMGNDAELLVISRFPWPFHNSPSNTEAKGVFV